MCNSLNCRNFANIFILMKHNKIPIHKIENFSGIRGLNVPKICVIKKCNYFIDESRTINGDAPKKFIGIYDYSLFDHKRKKNRTNWIRYIAKTGHKWYPIESITELLLNRLGTIFGLNMAESRIAMVGGQLRFMSRYFLKSSTEELLHGADILAGYLNDSIEFVEEVDKLKLTREFFTLQVIENAVESMFLYQKDEIMHNLVKLIIFDALVGNNDRHFFNWGIIRSINGSFQPYFAPIYDTARGLFWNYSEEKIVDIIYVNRTLDTHIKKYCKISRPKIGWDNEKNLNHFKLFERIYTNEFYITKLEIKELLSVSKLEEMIVEIKTHFSNLMSQNRIIMICECLEYRFNELKKML